MRLNRKATCEIECCEYYFRDSEMDSFILKLFERYPLELIGSKLCEKQQLVELEGSDKYKQVKAEVKKNLETPDELEKLAKNEDPIVRGIVAGSLRVTREMPKELVKKIVEIAEALGNDSHWYVRTKLLENRTFEHCLSFRAEHGTNIEDYEKFKKLKEKLKNDPDWRVAIEAMRRL